MKELIKGANAPLASAGKLRLRLCWNHAPGDLDLACFALDAQEQVIGDDWFLFYNQPASPRGAIRFDLARAEFLIQLDSLPDEIRKCVFTATLGQGHFGLLGDAALTVISSGGDGAIFRLHEPPESRSLLLAELYRYHDLWKIRARGEGLRQDLAMLARHFGVNIIDERHHGERSTSSPPPPRPAPIQTPAPIQAVPASPPPLPQSPAPPYDRHEKLKTYATLIIALGSLTTAITTVITQCTPHAPVVLVQAPTTLQQPAAPVTNAPLNQPIAPR
jgi:stress response protein SCP2